MNAALVSLSFAAFQVIQSSPHPGAGELEPSSFPELITASFSMLEPLKPNQRIFGLELWGTGLGGNADAILPGDFNGDGNDDLLVYLQPAGGWYVYLSTGQELQPDGQWADNFGAQSEWAGTGDFDGDGFADGIQRTGGTWEIALNSTNGGFLSPVVWDTGFGASATSQHVADFDGDGKDDILVFDDPPATWHVKRSNGQTFVDQGIWETGFGAGSSARFAGDVDGDGDSDVVAVFAGAGTWEVALNTGSNFSSQGPWATSFGQSAAGLFLSDLDGDGREDAAFYRSDADTYGRFEVARAAPSNQFEYLGTWHQDLGDPAIFELPFVADLNGDDRSDVVLFDPAAEHWRVGLTLPELPMPVRLARNDSESFFLLLYNESSPKVRDLNLSAQGLPDGVEVAFHHLGFIDPLLNDPANPSVADPLVPHSRKGPFDIPRGEQEIILVTVEAERLVDSGSHSAKILVRSGKSAPRVVPLDLMIWDFQVPRRPSLATDFRLVWQDFDDLFHDEALTSASMRIWTDELRARRISAGYESQKHYIDSSSSLSSSPIEGYWEAQDDEDHLSSVFLGYPGDLECLWPLFFTQTACVCSSPPCICAGLQGEECAEAMSFELLDHDAFQVEVDPIIAYAETKASSIPMPPPSARNFFFPNEGGGVWYQDGITAAAITRLNAGRSQFGVGSQHQLAGDFDGDGYDDLCAFTSGFWEVSLNRGDGSGEFLAQSMWETGFGASANEVFSGRLDGDSRDDILAYEAGPGAWHVKLSNGNTFVGGSTWISGFGTSSDTRFLADVDGDGRDDAIAFVESTGSWFVALNDGTSSFVNQGVWITNHGSGSDGQVVGDFDGDGDADAAIVLPSGEWHVARSDGAGFTSPITVFDSYQMPSSGLPLAGDVDGNGIDDFIVVSPDSGEWYVGLVTSAQITISAFCRATVEPFGLGADGFLVGAFGEVAPGQRDGVDALKFRSSAAGRVVGSWTVSLADGAGGFLVPRERNEFAGIRNVGPSSVDPVLREGIDTWVPSVADFGQSSPEELTDLLEVQSHGDRVWVWTDPGSANECGDCPDFDPSALPLESYVFPWLNWRYEVDGNHYWRVTLWKENPWCDPCSLTLDHTLLEQQFVPCNYSNWTCYRNEAQCNGTSSVNAVMSYPGFDNATGEPYFVSSVRLEAFRNGLEDYDYFALLQYAADVLGNSEAQTLLDRVEITGEFVGSGNLQESRWDVSDMSTRRLRDFRDYRRAMGELLEGITFPVTVENHVPGRAPPLRGQDCIDNTIN